jgi:hypothetical protein
MRPQKLALVFGLSFLPLTIAYCDGPGSPAEHTPLAMAAAPQHLSVVMSPEDRTICSVSPADNQDAIKAAIESCPNGSTVLFPAGQTYHQTDKIVVQGRSDLIIDGNGSSFLKTSPAIDGALKPNWQLENDTALVVRNMTVVGAFIPQATRSPTGGNQFEHGFFIHGGDRITIRDVVVSRVFGDAVTLASYGGASGVVPTNVRVERLTSEHTARMGIAITAGVGVWISDATMTNCHWSCVDVETNADGEAARDIHVLNLAVNGVWGAAVAVPGKHLPGDVGNIEIRGITMSDAPDTCFPAIQITYPPNNGGNTTLLEGIVIEDNYLKSINAGVEMTDVNSGSVRNNTITALGPLLCGPPARLAVKRVNSLGVVESGNTTAGY